MGNRGRPKHPDILTPREWEVLALLRENRTNEEIAEALGVTLATARFHVAEILGKLGVSSRHEAAAWQPEQEPTERRLWSFAPFVLLRRMKWQVLWAPLGVLTIVAALSLVAALAWGASRTRIAPTAFGDPANICTPWPTPTPIVYPPNWWQTPRPWSPEGPGPVITEAIKTESAWTDAYVAAGCDVRALPTRVFGTWDVWAGREAFTSVITRAEFVVRGHITSTAFKVDARTSLDFPVNETVIDVDETLKGHVAGRVTLRGAGGPIPLGVVSIAPGDQILLPGDDVLILGGGTSNGYEQAMVKFLIRNGTVHATPGGACDTIEGLPVAEASRIISDFVQRGVADPHLTASCDWSRLSTP